MLFQIHHIVTTGFCDVIYATTTALSAVRTETTANTTAISSLQSQLITLGIGAVVSGVFNFVDNIVSASVLSAQIATSFKLGGSQTLTSDVTANDNYNFFGSKPSQYAYLSSITSDIQSQLNSKQNIGNYSTIDYVNSISSKIYTNNNAVVNYELNNNLYNSSLSSLIYTNNNTIVNYELNNNLYNISLSSLIYTNNNAVISYELNNNL